MAGSPSIFDGNDMKDLPIRHDPVSEKSIPVRIALIYAIVGGIWIIFSDTLLQLFVSDVGKMTYYSIAKGILFVLITALMLYVLVRRGISALLKIQESLVQSEDRLRTFINATPDIVCFKDGQGRWLEANEAKLELFQLKEVDYTGKKDSELAESSGFYRDALLTCERTDEGTWQKRVLSRRDATILRPDGTCMTYDVIKIPLYHGDGRRKGLVVLGRDITERKRAEETLLESEQRVRRLNEQILNMVMVLSHDIRGPLVAIASILKLLLRGVYGKLDQSPANTVKDLLSRCARLLGTAEDYLGKASIVGSSMNMDREVLDLRQDIIDIVLDELADDITRHDIVIDNRLGAIPAGFISISANKTWLKAVYRNLFSNAIKYGEDGCTISFGFEQHESHYRLNVYNSGRPIAEEDREKIFSKFGRIEPLEGSIPDGVGLGLCLCREIILDHGGEIWYEARPDGSNFVFTISREGTGEV